MGNEILRYDNKSTAIEGVSIVSFGDKTKKQAGQETNNLLNLFKSENKALHQKLVLEESVPVDKPKLREPILLFVELITLSALLIYFCFSVNNLFFTVVLIAFTSVIIPVTFVFFFTRLNTRNKLETTQILHFLFYGVATCLLLDVVFDGISSYVVNYAYVISPLKSMFELIAILTITGFSIKSLKQYNVMTIMLVACLIASGFSSTKGMIEMFEIMFLRVQISSDGVTSAVGAIINTPDSVKVSITTLIYSLLNVGIFKPTIFISLAVINGFVLRYVLFKKFIERTPLGLVILFCFSMVITAISSFDSSIQFLQIIYTMISIFATGYALYQVLEFSVESENYK